MNTITIHVSDPERSLAVRWISLMRNKGYKVETEKRPLGYALIATPIYEESNSSEHAEQEPERAIA